MKRKLGTLALGVAITVVATVTTGGDLPLTGIEDNLIPIALVLLATGALVLALTRRPERA